MDQRFCPRIVEGEIRMNMIGDECTGIIHKKPKDRLTRVARLARRAAWYRRFFFPALAVADIYRGGCRGHVSPWELGRWRKI